MFFPVFRVPHQRLLIRREPEGAELGLSSLATFEQMRALLQSNNGLLNTSCRHPPIEAPGHCRQKEAEGQIKQADGKNWDSVEQQAYAKGCSEATEGEARMKTSSGRAGRMNEREREKGQKSWGDG